MKDNCCAVIMLATYNGAKYLKQQLESISNQSFQNWQLIISDDGSADETLDIIEEYRKYESRLIDVVHNQGDHGAFANFFHVMRYVKQQSTSYSYFFFCDQDDIWLSDKMTTEISRLKKLSVNNQEATMVYSDMRLMDGEGHDLNLRLSETTDLTLPNILDLFFSNKFVWGTSMAFNAALWDLIKIPDVMPAYVWHDHYVARYAAIFGKIDYIDKPLVRYRRHGKNVSALPRNYTFSQAVRLAIQRFWQVAESQGCIYMQVLFFIAQVGANKAFLQEYWRYIGRGGWRAIMFIWKWHISIPGNAYNRLGFYLILLTKAYKQSKCWNDVEIVNSTKQEVPF